MLLSDMHIGDRAIVKQISVNDDIKRRLLDMGIVQNTEIECLYESMFRDPVAYLVRGSILAVRKCDGKKIMVELL